MTRALTLGLLLIATAASSADLALATRHDELRALDVAPSRASPSPKVQWAPSGNFQALHTRAVFGSETETASRPYARENLRTAAGAGIFLSRDSVEGALNSAPSLHRFAYAHANPLRYIDPNGRGALEWLKYLVGGPPPTAGIDSCTASKGACNEAADVALHTSKNFNSAQAMSNFQAPVAAASAAAPEVGPIIVLGLIATGANIEAHLKGDKTPDPRVVQTYLEGCSAGGIYSCKRLDELGVPRPTVKVATEDSTNLSRLERIVPVKVEPDKPIAGDDPVQAPGEGSLSSSPANEADLAGRGRGGGGKGERGRTKNPEGTDNPFKKITPDPDNPKFVWYKDENGKKIRKQKPPGFDEYWKEKHPPPRPPRQAPEAPEKEPGQSPSKTDPPAGSERPPDDHAPPAEAGGERFEGGGGI